MRIKNGLPLPCKTTALKSKRLKQLLAQPLHFTKLYQKLVCEFLKFVIWSTILCLVWLQPEFVSLHQFRVKERLVLRYPISIHKLFRCTLSLRLKSFRNLNLNFQWHLDAPLPTKFSWSIQQKCLTCWWLVLPDKGNRWG